MATTTGQSLVTKALRRIGVVGQGQSAPSMPILNEAFDELNDMIDEWATESTLIYVVEEATFPLTSGTGTYTLGPGGTFNRVRPPQLDRASIISNNNPSQPLELALQVLDLGQWQGIPVKNVQSALPRTLYRDYAFPLMNITLWPKPNVGNLDIKLYCPTQLSEFATLGTSYNIPPGYLNALKYNLAYRLCDYFGKPVPQTLPELASKALAKIEIANIHPQMIAVDNALVARSDRFNYYTGEPMGGGTL